jgi:hypothetical protein
VSIPEYWTHGDTQMKFERLYKHGVHVLLSGSPSSATELIAFFNRSLDLSDGNEEDILSSFQACAAKYRERLVDRYLQMGWSISLESYRRGEVNYLPQETLRRIADEIGPGKIDFECDLIFVCFDNRKNAKLLTMDYLGRFRDVTSSGFAVTGSGVVLATSQMYARDYGYFEKLNNALYSVFEAKKRSEAEVTVGPDTSIMVVDPSDFIWVDPDGIAFLEEEFRSRNKPIRIELPDYFWMHSDDYSGVIDPYTEGSAKADDSGAAPSERGEEAKE